MLRRVGVQYLSAIKAWNYQNEQDTKRRCLVMYFDTVASDLPQVRALCAAAVLSGALGCGSTNTIEARETPEEQLRRAYDRGHHYEQQTTADNYDVDANDLALHSARLVVPPIYSSDGHRLRQVSILINVDSPNGQPRYAAARRYW